MKQSNNPASLRSKDLLANSLYQLMLKKPYEEIMLKEITEHAQVARTTFYNNFKTKDEILVYFCEKLMLKYKTNLSYHDKVSVYILTFEFFAFWKDNIEFVSSLTEQSALIIISQSRQFIIDLNETYHIRPEIASDDPTLDFRLSFIVGGLMNLGMFWIKNGAKQSPSEMANLLTSILRA